MLFSLQPYFDHTIALAVSGGRDSMALLHCFLSARERIRLIVVHCEHGIRGEASLADERFVKDYAARQGVDCISFHEDCPALAKQLGVSLESAARVFRYRVFDELLASGRVDLVATAHHADDNAETVLFRLCRGTSLSGAAGIVERKGYIRPLLDVTREEIDDYVRQNAVPYREDETNADAKITRNFLRGEILPKLSARIPGTVGNLNRFAALAAEDDALLFELARPLVQGESVLIDERTPLFARACLSAMKALGVTEGYTQRHLDELVALRRQENGKRVCLPCGVIACREYDRIVFTRNAGERTEEVSFTGEVIAFGAGEVRLGTGKLRFDGDALPKDCVVRTRRAGDRFRPFGGGDKTIGDWMTDRKIPLRLRDAVPLVAKGGRVYIVIGYEIAEEIKVTEGTKTAVRIEYTTR
ncbi:MAG: tRNA lysidine(34) synthetase TilS [Christensenellaceae bacterium]